MAGDQITPSSLVAGKLLEFLRTLPVFSGNTVSFFPYRFAREEGVSLKDAVRALKELAEDGWLRFEGDVGNLEVDLDIDADKDDFAVAFFSSSVTVYLNRRKSYRQNVRSFRERQASLGRKPIQMYMTVYEHEAVKRYLKRLRRKNGE